MVSFIENCHFIDIHVHSSFRDENVLCLRNLYPEDAVLTDFTLMDRCYSLGIHPWKVKESGEHDFELLEKFAWQDNVLAIGETGLDKLCKIDFNLQEQLFEKQLVISKITGKPVIIHCVKAYREIINYRKKYPDQPWIVHRFNASEELSEELYQKGFYFSFGNLILNPATKACKILKTIPLDRVFFETDDFPVSIAEIYEAAAALRKMQIADLQNIIKNNFKNCFKNQK